MSPMIKPIVGRGAFDCGDDYCGDEGFQYVVIMVMMMVMVMMVIWIKRRVKTATIRRRMVVGTSSTLTIATTIEDEDVMD